MKTLPEQQAEAWQLAPDDAKWIAQDEDGTWTAFYVEPVNTKLPSLYGNWFNWSNECHLDKKYVLLHKDKINGWDWRNTLQSREEFEAMKSSNKHTESQKHLGPSGMPGGGLNIVDEWKDGLPPVGKCEWSQWNNDVWVHVTVHAVSDKMAIISEANGKQFAVYLDTHGFRPIKSEADKLRDEQIKEMAHLCRSMDSGLITAASMYKAGCRMTRELTPEDREKLRAQFILEAISEDPDAFIDLVASYVRGELEL